MTDAKKTQVWGYNKDGGKIFELGPKDKLPAGYFDCPSKVGKAKPKKAKK